MKTILLIEDNEADRFFAEEILNEEFSDVEILCASDGEEALDLLDSMNKEPDIILLDINMPRMDGHEFLKAYSKDNARKAPPVVVMLTSSEQDRDKHEALKYQLVQGYFLKPLGAKDMERINQLTEAFKQAD